MLSRCSQHVLEVGYGLGLSTRAILAHSSIVTHTVIECHLDVLKRCHDTFSAEINSGRLLVKQGFWQDVVSILSDSSFDGILYDTYPLVKQDEEVQLYAFFKEAYRLLKPGGIFTYFSAEGRDFVSGHLQALKEAGFTNIRSEICNVDSPKTCHYWQAKTIMEPIVQK